MDITEALEAFNKGDVGGAIKILRKAGGDEIAESLERMVRGVSGIEVRPRRVGVFGGGFDPIHHAHLIFAQEAMMVANLDKIILVPSANPADREIPTAFEHRFKMCELAVGRDRRFEISNIEYHLDLSFTRDTISQLRLREYKEDDLYLLVGGDRASSIFDWEGIKGLVESLSGVVCVAREGHDRKAIVNSWVDGAERFELPDDIFMPTILKMPPNHLSATYIRERVRNGHPINYMVPEAVARYISETGLYRE
jgi:nicotinate-nucleotide adenylyltransferase